VYFRVPVCAQPTGHGKCSATPTLFPFSGHPTDLSFLGDFCWGMYRFPAVHPRMSSFATVSAMGIPGWGHSRATWREAGHYSIGLQFFSNISLAMWRHGIGSPICSGIIIHCTFSRYYCRPLTTMKFWGTEPLNFRDTIVWKIYSLYTADRYGQQFWYWAKVGLYKISADEKVEPRVIIPIVSCYELYKSSTAACDANDLVDDRRTKHWHIYGQKFIYRNYTVNNFC